MVIKLNSGWDMISQIVCKPQEQWKDQEETEDLPNWKKRPGDVEKVNDAFNSWETHWSWVYQETISPSFSHVNFLLT